MRLFQLLTLVLALTAAGPLALAEQPDKPLFDHVTDKARKLAEGGQSRSGDNGIPDALADLNYSQYRDIRFKKDHALWKDDAMFNVELFHLGFLYRQPVVLHEVVDGEVRTVKYDGALFDYGKNQGLGEQLGQDLGFAGFRIHFPINRKDYHDEVIAFLGASYFRMLGSGQSYGLSARGLAVNTALPEGEEFPRFTEFWLVRPEPGAHSMTLYALLMSKSVVGAYQLDLKPGTNTVLDVEARLFARRDVQKLGVAPLTSMFLFGENSVQHFDDHRPEVHDSDGLLMHTGGNEWIWRPLTNGKSLQVSSLLDQSPNGFGLVQRDRRFDSYLDMEARYQRRPSHWISPSGGDWGKGAVELIEIPSREETNDNIVAFWVPDEKFKAGQERTFKYSLRTFGSKLAAEQLAVVKRTRIGWGAIPGMENKPPRSLRQFIVDFTDGELSELDGSQPVEAELSTSSGEVRDVNVTRLPADHGWRVAFKLQPEEGKPSDMRMFLTFRDRRVSETWNYVWRPEIIN